MEALGITWTEVLWGNIIFFLGAFLQTITGIGLAIIAVTLLFFLQPEYIPSSILIIATTLSVLNAFRFFSDINKKALILAIMGRIPGIFIAILLFQQFNNFVINIFIGSFIIFYSFLDFFRLQQLSWKKTIIGGFFSGITGTLSGIGGPPLGIVLKNLPQKSFISTIACYFIFGNSLSLGALFFIKKAASNQIFFALFCLPGCLLAFKLAPYFIEKMPKKIFENLIKIFCIIAGVVVIIKALLEI